MSEYRRVNKYEKLAENYLNSFPKWDEEEPPKYIQQFGEVYNEGFKSKALIRLAESVMQSKKHGKFAYNSSSDLYTLSSDVKWYLYTKESNIQDTVLYPDETKNKYRDIVYTFATKTKTEESQSLRLEALNELKNFIESEKLKAEPGSLQVSFLHCAFRFRTFCDLLMNLFKSLESSEGRDV